MMDALRRRREADAQGQGREPEPPRVEFVDALSGEQLAAEVSRDGLGIVGPHPVAGVPVYLVAVPPDALRAIARLFAEAEDADRR